MSSKCQAYVEQMVLSKQVVVDGSKQVVVDG